MPNQLERLDFNVTQNGWEPVRYLDSDGDAIAWHAAAVRHGSGDVHEIYQAGGDGNVYQVETGDDDNGEPIVLLARSKRVALGGWVGLLHTLFVRGEAVDDTITLQVTAGGAEYGEVSHTYTIDLDGSGDNEVKQRLHRDLVGRWVEVEIGGDVSNRPSIREMRVIWIPVRMGRYSA